MKTRTDEPMRHAVRKGLDLPLTGGGGALTDGPEVRSVALMPDDWIGVAARPLVEVGTRVKAGEPIFEDRRNPGVIFTSPGTGEVSAIHRGDRRAVQSVVVKLDGSDECADFPAWRGETVAKWSGDDVRRLMLQAGTWPALRERPFGTVPPAGAPACPIFVTAIDTNPLAPDPAIAISRHVDAFKTGLTALVLLAGGHPVYACVSSGFNLTGATDVPGVRTHSFSGPHPAGLPGTHIHMVSPASVEAPRWHIGYQDVIALGVLLQTGRPCLERVIGVGGPSVAEPIVWITRVGVELGPLLTGRLRHGENRVISGSVLFGRSISDLPQTFVGFFHNQVCAIPEETGRDFLGWLSPGLKRFSILPIFLSKLAGERSLRFDTATNGSPRAVMPFGVYERVMPLDMMATELCRALMAGNAEWAAELGALELIEEDLALCTLVCPGKNDYGPALRSVLETIRKEG
ncbi:Na(+)-translocating NADH-quinone reductase subunit A [Myxococcota bacterium]|nr:Na(+)-translocating NADH-quinone reductase subunit A [Myxococcota bacterium]